MTTTLSELYGHPPIAPSLRGLVRLVAGLPHERVFWIGAGISRKYAGLPTWSDWLTNFVKSYIVEPDEKLLIQNLMKADRMAMAAECAQELRRDEFSRELSTCFQNAGNRLSKVFERLNVCDVITTNYDELIEKRFSSHAVINPTSGMTNLLSAVPKVVKLHGSADDPKSCVASFSSYIKNYDNNLEWYLASTFIEKQVIFLGSSMSRSEPFFRTIDLVRSRSVAARPHYCVLPVKTNSEAKLRSKQLAKSGIRVIPYFPDKNHSFLDELLEHLASRAEVAIVEEKCGHIKRLIERNMNLEAGVMLHNLLLGTISSPSHKKQISDLVSFYFNSFDDSDSASIIKVGERLLSKILELRLDKGLRNGKYLRMASHQLRFIMGGHNMGFKRPDELFEKFNSLATEWNRSSSRHPEDVVDPIT